MLVRNYLLQLLTTVTPVTAHVPGGTFRCKQRNSSKYPIPGGYFWEGAWAISREGDAASADANQEHVEGADRISGRPV